MENDKTKNDGARNVVPSGEIRESESPTQLLLPGWTKYQRRLWSVLALVYGASSAAMYLFGGQRLFLSFLWGALLFCASIGLTLRLMAKTVAGGRGIRTMFFLSGGKLMIFAALLFVGLAQFSLDPVALFSGAFLGLMATSLFGFWVASRSASFY